MVVIARGCDGVLGSRMTGAGFGGCTVTLVAADQTEALERAIRTQYPGQTGFQPEVYICKPGGGAKEVK